jgi:hypothetical protein
MRGFENTQMKEINQNVWYEVSKKGRYLSEVEASRNMVLGEFVTKRLSTIMIARELFFKRYSMFLFDGLSALDLGVKFGYRLWGKYFIDGKSDLYLREKFLISFTRRQETQNLVISELFYRRRIKRGEEIQKNSYDNSYFSRALSSYVSSRDSGSVYNYQEDYKLMNSMKKKFWKKINEK